MKAILQTVLKPRMTRMNAEARGCITKEPRANHRQVLDCPPSAVVLPRRTGGSPLPLSNRNEVVRRGTKRQAPPRRSGALALREGGRAGALQDASRPRRTSIFRPASCFLLLAFSFQLFLIPATAATRYVWQDSPSPGPPYTNWTSAAHVIQDAVDAAQTGDTVRVAGGVYATGGRAVGTSQLVNRVAVDRAIKVESLMGPEVTIIQGYQVPGMTNGDGAIRCVYLTNGASLSGFTLTSGATRTNGDYFLELCGGGLWCESTNAVASNCVLVGNSAFSSGGGAYVGTLNNCTLTGNSANGEYGSGGGVAGDYYNPCTLNNCTLTGNSAYLHGGGAADSTLNNCTVVGNSANYGGGASWGTLNNCTLTGNSANGEYGSGGGAADSTLNHCTLTGNSAGWSGGGLYGECFTGGSRVINCIVYFNTAPVEANFGGDAVTMDYCCTTPLPAGTGNITLDPQLTSASHLSAHSPCRGAASTATTTGTDIDGEAWSNPPSIGCDEYHPGPVTGPLSVAITAEYTNVATGLSMGFVAQTSGRARVNVWEFGDGTTLSNSPFAASHSWSAGGDYLVVFRAYNDTYPAGVSAAMSIRVLEQPVHYVAIQSANPVPPYTSWATAATNIQDAVDAAVAGGQVVVSNGVYANGGRTVAGMMTNRAAVTKPLAVRSANGPEFTIIQGYQLPGTTNGDGAIRCVYLTSDASLSGFTLTHGATRAVDDDPTFRESSGGGVFCESTNAVVSNCVVVGNSAYLHGGGAYDGTLNNCTLTGNSAGYGGGVYWSELTNCTLTDNSAGHMGGGASYATLNHCRLTGNFANGTNSWEGGGGAYGGTLNHCMLSGNSAQVGGGAYYGTLNHCTLAGNSAAQKGGGAYGGTPKNCVVYFNAAPNGANYVDAYLNYCCTIPMPTGGLGNITNTPLFVDYAAGNLRPQSHSPCINAGNNAYVTSPTDLDGNPRIVSGTVDIGAYEFQGPGSVISYAWLQQYGLPTDGSADALDADLDGHSAWREWKCWTDPTNALSVLKLFPPEPQLNGTLVRWQSVLGQSYSVECTTNANGSFSLLQGNIPGQTGTTSITDTNPANGPPILYRVGVSE